MDYGLKVARDGYSVDSGNENLVFNSSLPSQKIFAEGLRTITGSATSSTVTINHNLGYCPQFIVYGDTLGVVLPYYIMDDALGYVIYASAKVTKTSLTITVQSFEPSNKDFVFKYMILVDPI